MPSIRPPMSACIAGLVASALGGVAMASPMQFTTLNSATISLSSYLGSPVTSSVTYPGPTTGTPGGNWTSMGPLSAPNTGVGQVLAGGFSADDSIQLWYSPPLPGGQFTVRFTFDLTFNATSGSVTLASTSFPLNFGAWTVTPQGGSTATLANGDVFANGRYSFVWDYVEPNSSGVDNGLTFSPSSGPSAVPGGAGLAALAFGAAGLRRRRRA